MEQHVAPSTLTRLFSGEASRLEADTASSHLSRCAKCRKRAAVALAELEAARAIEEREALGRLLASARWAELAGLPPEAQIQRIKEDARLRTREMFDTVIEAASASAASDPFLGEETALVASALAASLPEDISSEAQKSDLQSEALGVAANCRRLAADWRGSAEAFKQAHGHLGLGTGDRGREARLLSLQASLAMDTGYLEKAADLLARAGRMHGEAEGMAAALAVQRASTLLAASRHEEAISQAEKALRLLSPNDIRLEMLARNIITASLVFLGRPAVALRNHIVALHLHEHLPGQRSDLHEEYLEALLLDSLGCAWDAESAFRSNIARRMEAELYKDAFLTMMTRFELRVRRGEWARAAQACEEALAAMKEAEIPFQNQLEDLWRGLLALVEARRLSEQQLESARLFLVRYWYVPAKGAPLEGVGLSANAGQLALRRVLWAPGTADSARKLPGPGGGEVYEAALERYDRALLVQALAQCGGRAAETARLLKIARGTLREKMKRYGIAVEAPVDGLAPGDLTEQDKKTLGRLRARVWWRDLQKLPAADRLARVRGWRMLRTRELVDTILEEAAAIALRDPGRGEEAASLAHTLASLLPPGRCTGPIKQDLQGAALGIAGNCRRLAGDWKGATAALSAARTHLGRGTGDLARQARLLSFQTSLATDMAQDGEALSLLERASVLYRQIRDAAGVAFTAVQQTSTLLAAGRHAEAVACAEETLGLLAPGQVRLEILARNVLTSSLLYLGRPAQALRNLQVALRLARQAGGAGTELQAGYLEGLVLEAFGFEREADAVFQANLSARMEAGLYKDVLLTLLTRFELRVKRGDLAKAAEVCQEAIERMETADKERHARTIELWRDLLALVVARQLTDLHLQEKRKALVTCWANPDASPAVAAQPVEPAGGLPATRQDRRLHAGAEPPAVPDRLRVGEYKTLLTLYDRTLIEEALVRCEGRMGAACEMLGLAPGTLRERVSRYGLKVGPGEL